METYCWLIALAVLLIIEILTLGLTTVWFAGGALIAFFAGLAGADLTVQLLLFFITSIILLFFTRPIAVRYLNNKRTKTNYESIIGLEGIVEEEINNLNQTGRVILNGQDWAARSTEDRITYPPGVIVKVAQIQGVKLIVTDKEEVESNAI